MWVFNTIMDDSDPSRSSELLLGALHLEMYENILSSLALECGMVKIFSATLNKRSNCGTLVPGLLTECK